MARKVSTRSALYKAARFMGDVQALQRGPQAYAKRVVRRTVYRRVNGTLAKVLRAGGL